MWLLFFLCLLHFFTLPFLLLSISPCFPGLWDELIRPISSTHTEFHLLRWHCRIPIGNTRLYCPHNYPMKYSFFVSKYLSHQNRTDNHAREFHTCTYTNALTRAHMHGALPCVYWCLKTLRMYSHNSPHLKGAVWFCAHQIAVQVRLMSHSVSYLSQNQLLLVHRTFSFLKCGPLRCCAAGCRMNAAEFHYLLKFTPFSEHKHQCIRMWASSLNLTRCLHYSGVILIVMSLAYFGAVCIK